MICADKSSLDEFSILGGGNQSLQDNLLSEIFLFEE